MGLAIILVFLSTVISWTLVVYIIADQEARRMLNKLGDEEKFTNKPTKEFR